VWLFTRHQQSAQCDDGCMYDGAISSHDDVIQKKKSDCVIYASSSVRNK